MFARNTPTRMRRSAVVQGLKSLASKLHPQLPLSVKESQRLLTALTTSFRKQLDQAHPPQTGAEEGTHAATKHGLSKAATKQLHSSSATFADRHLASVLTNPLLSQSDSAHKPGLNLEFAKVDLDEHPGKDPMMVLEEYHEKGAATVPIAVLCLEKFNERLNSLPKGQREAVIKKANAGKRTLLWLWNSKIYETDEFVENVRFMGLLCSFLVREHSEEYFWDWWKIDLRLGAQQGPTGMPNSYKDAKHQYRWKTRMLKALVLAKLHLDQSGSADSALETFLQACDIKKSAIQQNVPAYQYPLKAAWFALADAFNNDSACLENTDPELYDRTLHQQSLVTDVVKQTRQETADNTAYQSLHIAKLWLLHPRDPSPMPALQMYKDLYGSESPKNENLEQFLTSNEHPRRRKNLYYMMVRTIALLQEQGRTDDADWVIDLLPRLYATLPEASKFNGHLGRERAWYQWRSSNRSRVVRYTYARHEVPPSQTHISSSDRYLPDPG